MCFVAVDVQTGTIQRRAWTAECHNRCRMEEDVRIVQHEQVHQCSQALSGAVRLAFGGRRGKSWEGKPSLVCDPVPALNTDDRTDISLGSTVDGRSRRPRSAVMRPLLTFTSEQL
jgi:hypothetical protein